MQLHWNAIGRGLFRAYRRLMLRLDLQQSQPLPPGPKILAANHPTTSDPFVMLSLSPDPISILVTAAIFDLPFFGQFLHRSGQIPVPRQKAGGAFEAAVNRLQYGWTVGIFPEGNLSGLHGQPPQARTGAVRLALTAGVPVIPIGMAPAPDKIWYRPMGLGSEQVVGRFFLYGRYAVTFGQPMHFTGDLEDRDYVRRASEHLLARILQLARQSELRLGSSRSTSGIMPHQPKIARRQES